MSDSIIAGIGLFIMYFAIVHLVGWILYFLFLRKRVTPKKAFSIFSIIGAIIATTIFLLLITIGIR